MVFMKEKYYLNASLITGLILFSYSGFLSADIYRWTDAQGNVHFGDKPGVNDSQKVEVKITKPDKNTKQVRVKSAEEVANELQASRQQRESARQRRDTPITNARNDPLCEAKRSEAKSLQKELNRMLPPPGNRHGLTPDHATARRALRKQEKMKEINVYIKKNC